MVCDLDGKDEADDYDEDIVVYKDLRNHEHGLVRGPDERLYMSRGNSKGPLLI